MSRKDPGSIADQDSIAEEQQKKAASVIAESIHQMVLNTPGVEKLSRRAVTGLNRKKTEKKTSKGVRVTIRNNSLLLNIHIVIRFGKSIPELARQIQKDAKEFLLRSYPDLQLSAVNVWVDSVRFDQESFLYRKKAIDTLTVTEHTAHTR
ncbi:MAG: Asp23/Gls24 family envelope stress response protein [Clostridiales bacterium]|nr:Asp23/Gls24 family envelope stress response protein [Clostridiales bacterium]